MMSKLETGDGSLSPFSTKLCQGFFAVFVQEQVGVDDAGFLVDGDGQDDIPASAGIERGISGKLQRSCGLPKSELCCKTKAQHLVAAGTAAAFHDLIIVGALQAAPADQFAAAQGLHGFQGTIVGRKIVEAVCDLWLFHKGFHLFC